MEPTALDEIQAKLRTGQELTEAEQNLAREAAIYTEPAMEEPPASDDVPKPEPRPGFVLHEHLEAWVNDELAPKLSALSRRLDTLENQVRLLTAGPGEQADLLDGASDPPPDGVDGS